MTTAAFPTELHERPPQPELFGQERLERHAEQLAAGHRLEREAVRGRPLLPHVEQSARQLDTVYRRLSAAPRPPQAVPSEDWLRDNYHVVLDQVRAIRQDLPRKYYFELPKLADGPFAGYPRVFVVARDLVIHTAGRFDLQTLVGYVVAYQKGAPLSIGEIWAIAIMLRVALVDELRRLADDVLAASEEREEARRWGVIFSESPSEPAKVIEASLKAATKKTGRLSAAFVVELLQWLRDQPSSSAPAWLALQRALDQQADSADEMLRREHQREAANQLAIGNIITTMRLLSSIDWPQFFERVSLVEQILREDPAEAYERMDFPTRDRYRHSVEELARGSKQPERAVARRAVQLAQEARWKSPGLDRQHHVGYYLISRGRLSLETELGYPPTARERFSRFFFQYPSLGYPGSLAVGTAVVMASILSYAARQGASAGELWLVALFTLLPVAELTVGLVNLLVTTQVRPRPLPKLDFRTGIPAANRTMVVVPALVG
ncbi:MAG: GH36-type glycosyl hydrolase domain-containing protein, partial [Vicinamibacterales bacterium]